MTYSARWAAVAAMALALLPAAAWADGPTTQPTNVGGAVAVAQPSTQPMAMTPTTMPAMGPTPLVSDVALDRARKYVESSDRYLHHSRLKRGMKGYGKTVMAGVKIERFNVEIVSVMDNWGPHQDVILAKLSGLDLEKTNVIAGMSGSPVYVVDPRDGKEKLIGAVAYGWSAQKEPLCGIQPITQMLAVNGVLSGPNAATNPSPGKEPAIAAGDGKAPKAFLEMVLNPRKVEYAQAFMTQGGGKAKAKSSDSPTLLPLRTPLMVSGMGQDVILRSAATLKDYGMVPVQSGGSAGAGEEADHAKLEPGSGIAIPLVSGDSDMCAVGTVTDVINGKKVLAFGHSFFAEGDTKFPMGPAYVHSVVSGVVESFKLGSPLKTCGVLQRDETVAISGTIGDSVAMIPMSVDVNWKDLGEKQHYNFNIVKHRFFTPQLVGFMIDASAVGWKNLPENHTLSYTAIIDFGDLGVYKVSNISSHTDTLELFSDVVRPLQAMFRNPWSVPPDLRSIKLDVTVEEKTVAANVIDLKLDGRTYRPGETVTGTVTIEPYRQPRTTMKVKFELPHDLAEGTYTLQVCDATDAVRAQSREMPQRFDPRNLKELLQSVQIVTGNRNDCLYLRLPLNEGGLAIRKAELADLPDSKAAILAQSDRNEAKPFSKTIVRTQAGPYVFNGSAAASFDVDRTPKELITREGEAGK